VTPPFGPALAALGRHDSKPDAFPGDGPTNSGAPRDTRVVETHVSVLFFLGDRVYKLRKPVHFGFLDFSTREEREADCHREVELNSRFSPDVYLGVADVYEEGRAIDHLVVMRRLPEDRRLATMVRDGADLRQQIRSIARLIADVDLRSERLPQFDEAATADAVLGVWRSGFEEIAPFVGSIVDPVAEARLQTLVETFLAGRKPLLSARIANGRVRDGHGDLQAEDIFCLDDGPRILDCLEFDDRLRYCDVLADLAFLAMDLERLGVPSLAGQLFEDYEELSGDRFPRALSAHYCAARAYVRAKVACLSAAQGAEGAAETAQVLHALALSFLERSRVRLVVVGGLPGRGKSTLAAGLAERLGMVVLRSDEIRKELASAVTTTSGESGLYGTEMTRATYGALVSRARSALELGQSVILDASWSRQDFRSAARRVAEETSSEFTELRCEVSEPVAEGRIARRLRVGSDASEANVEVARQLATLTDPWPSSRSVDTSGPEGRSLERALALIDHD